MSISFWWIIGGLGLVVLAVWARKPSKAARQHGQHNETLRLIQVTKPKNLSSAKQRGLRSPAMEGWEAHKFGDNAPVGDWVQWTIGSGWFEVKGLFHRQEKAREFLRLAAQADARGEPLTMKQPLIPANLYLRREFLHARIMRHS